MGSLQNKVMGLDEWKQEVSTVVPVTDDMDLMVEHLKANGKLLTDHISHVQVVKMAYPKLSKKAEITSAEKSQYDIARTIQILEADLTGLVEKQEQYENFARQALKEGKRSTVRASVNVFPTPNYGEQLINNSKFDFGLFPTGEAPSTDKKNCREAGGKAQ